MPSRQTLASFVMAGAAFSGVEPWTVEVPVEDFERSIRFSARMDMFITGSPRSCKVVLKRLVRYSEPLLL
jgi:hypothetical protein